MSKSIKITESQYKRLLLSEDLDSACEFTGGDYNNKGSYVIKSGNKEYIFGKNKSKKYSKYFFGALKDSDGNQTKFYYNCEDNIIFYGNINNKKLNLKSEINTITNKSVKSVEDVPTKGCMKIGTRLKIISNKIDKSFSEENIPNFGCVIRYKNINKGGVNYTLSFAENPNIYEISFNSNNPFKLISGSFLDNLIQDNDEYKALLDQDIKSIVFNGKYKIGNTLIPSLYYININTINGKTHGKFINEEQDISDIDEIINSFGISDYKLSDEEKKKINPIEWSANQIEDRVAGWTSDDDFMEIYQEIISYNCNDLDKLKKIYKDTYKKELRADINHNTTFPSWSDYIDDLSEYLNGRCSDENKKKLVGNLDKMKND